MRSATLYQSPAVQKRGRKKKHLGIRKAAVTLFTVLLGFFLAGVFLLYGPIDYFRVSLVTQAMATMRHQWIATMLFDSKTISDIMARNKVIALSQNTDPKKVTVNSNVRDNATELPTSPSDGEHIIDGVGFTVLKGSTYSGWLIKVYDPSRVYLGVAQNYGTQGEKVSHMASRLGAYVGINAGGFVDIGGEGNGGIADATFISKGKLLQTCKKETVHSIIGFDYSNKLLLGEYTQAQITALHLRDAVEFKPLLIVNGTAAQMVGNGGYGYDPRTAIGQTKTGTIIFVVINGRSLKSRGASIRDLQNIMLNNGAYNAANLDGGSSSVVSYNGKIINTPSGPAGERYLPNGFLIQRK